MKTSLLAGFLGLTALFGAGAASAGIVTVTTSGCAPTNHVIPDTFGSRVFGPVANCNSNPHILSERFQVTNGLNSAQHIHRAIYSTVPPNDANFSQTFEIISTPTLVPGGWFMDVQLDGFAAPQGNPDEFFTYFARMESTYQGVTIFAEESGSAAGGAQVPIKGYDFFNCFGCAVGGPFVSKLMITMSGKGELHFSSSGVADLVGVPEPSSWVLMFSGVGFVGAFIRRQKRIESA